jgi:hypothetical protein
MFCAGCMNRWVADEKTANFEALATAIEGYGSSALTVAGEGWRAPADDPSRDVTVRVDSDGRIGVAAPSSTRGTPP